MSNGALPNSPGALIDLQKSERLQETLARERAEQDCWPCKITGTAAFAGLGAYSYWSGQRQLELQRAKILRSGSMFGMKSRQAGITGIAMTLVGMGFWRLVN